MDDIEFNDVVDMLAMVPVRDMLPIVESSASARSNTLPEKALAKDEPVNDALCGVEGTVACTAGPRAALICSWVPVELDG
jgi:hypothetical protein